MRIKLKRNKLKNRINLTEEQIELINWLIHHNLFPCTKSLYEVLSQLFEERNSKHPDKCIEMYDQMSMKERNEIYLILSRYYADYYNNGRILTLKEIIERYAYIE